MVYAQPSSAGGPPDDGEGPKRKARRSHLFAVLVGFAGGVAVSAVAFVIFATGSPARSNTGAAPAAPAAPAEPEPPSPATSAVLHEGVVTLHKGNAIDLDSTAADWGETSSPSSRDDLELAPGGTLMDYPPAKAYFVQVHLHDPATYMTCLGIGGHLHVQGFEGPGEAANNVSTDLRFCVLTTQDRLAYVAVTAAPYDPTAGVPRLDSVTVKVTTWARPVPLGG
jgi:hypothetical protein